MTSLPARPSRVAAYGSTAGALMHLGIRPVAIFSGALESLDGLEGLDTTGIESLGAAYGEVNVEKIAALGVDLIVMYDPRQNGLVFGSSERPVQDNAAAVAPIPAIDGIKDPVDVIRRLENLAESLVTDLAAPAVAAARARVQPADGRTAGGGGQARS